MANNHTFTFIDSLPTEVSYYERRKENDKESGEKEIVKLDLENIDRIQKLYVISKSLTWSMLLVKVKVIAEN